MRCVSMCWRSFIVTPSGSVVVVVVVVVTCEAAFVMHAF